MRIELWITEVLLKDLARFRDIKLGPQGELYLLLENKAGSRIIRPLPAAAKEPAAH